MSMSAAYVTPEPVEDAPLPWSVVPVVIEASGLKVYHLVDARSHSLLSSSAVNGRGPELQRQMLERICAAVNSSSPDVEGLARAVIAEDLLGTSWSTRRHHASSLLAHHIVGDL